MRIVSENFRDALRGIKELIGVVSYKTKGGNILTQANEYLLTQDDGKLKLENTGGKYRILTTEHSTMLTTEANKLIATEKEVVEIDNDNIISINIRYDGKLLSTICQSLQIECKEDIEVNTKINVKIGVLVGEEYEYLDMGNFYNINPSEYQLDSDSYVITAYDRMYRCMIKYDNGLNFPCTHRECLESILNKHGIDFNIPSYANENKVIPKDYWNNLEVTYRDILDELCTSGGFGAIIKNNKFIPKTYYDTQEILNGEDLQDNSVSIGEKYGPINLVEISNADGILIEIGKDGSSIEENGTTEFNLGLNRILENDENGEYYQSVFNALNGLEFYTYDLASTGVLIFEPLDMFSIKYHGLYPTILLNDSITLTTGLKEDLILERPEENVETYVTSAVNDEKIKNAFVRIDKANGQIVLKATSDGRVVQAELNADADNGTEFNVKADQVNFDAHTFNLTSDNIKIISNNFSVDEEGNMECSNAKVNGGNIELISIASSGPGGYGEPSSFRIIPDVDDPLSRTQMLMYCNSIRCETARGDQNACFDLSAIGNGMGGQKGYFSLFSDDDINPTIEMDGEIGSIVCKSIETEDVYYQNLYPSSLEEKKKNFEKFDNALDIIEDVDIYKYNYKTEEDDTKKHIGLVIGKDFKYRQEVTSKDNKGADIYSMVGVLWKAVQEQQEQIEELKKEVANANRKD